MAKPTAVEKRKLNDDVKRIQSLPYTYVVCRCVGHAWSRIEATRTPPFGVLLTWECMRCSTIRDDIVDRYRGALLSRSYRYADGYRVPSDQQGHSGVKRDAVRVALLDRESTDTL